MARVDDVTAVVLNYDGRHLLEVILPSLARQTRPPDRIVVVDNGSSDGSRDYLRQSWSQVEVVEIPTNVGVAVAMNRGVEAASGGYVALLNNDLELEPDWLQEMLNGLERHPEAASVACKLLSYRQRDRLDGAGDGLTRAMIPYKRGSGELDRGQYDREEEVLAPTAGAALYRASALAQVGPFDESFWAYFEDVDWGLRAQLAGYRSWYLPGAVGYHMGGATTGGDRDGFYLRLHRRNLIGMIVKDIPGSVLLRASPLIMREQAAGLVDSAHRGMLSDHLQALLEATRRMPSWLRARRRIQRARRLSPRHMLELLGD